MKASRIKGLLIELDLSEEDLDWMWDFSAAYPEQGGSLIRKLKDQGLGWRDLSYPAAKSLPKIYNDIYKDVMENGIKI